MPVTSYSRTPADNNSSPPNGWPEGQSAASVNNCARQMMTDIVNEAAKGQARVLASVAGTNTITASMTPDLDAYTAGMMVVFTPANNNSGATTLNIDALGALDVQKFNGDALVSGDLVAGIPAVLVLDSGADDWILLNPLTQTFTTNLTISSAQPNLFLNETDAAADNRLWRFVASGEEFVFQARNDALSSGGDILVVNRTGTTVDSINLLATSVQYNGIEVGFRGIPQNTQTSGTYTCVLADAGKHIHTDGSTTGTVTIPANASVAYAVGTVLTVTNGAAATSVTIAITSDTLRLAGTSTTGSRTLAAGGIASAIKIASTTWLISGTGLS